MTSPPRSQPDSVTIPREPTREMWAAMADAVVGKTAVHHDVVVSAVYQALLASAPTPPPQCGVQTAQADYNVGRWLSAALEDPVVCAEMKADINAWFEAHPACTCGGDPYQPASEHDISCPSALSSANHPCAAPCDCGGGVKCTVTSQEPR